VVTGHSPLPLNDPAPNEEPDSPVDLGEARPRWYWPLFAAMLLVLVASAMLWLVVVFKAVVP